VVSARQRLSASRSALHLHPDAIQKNACVLLKIMEAAAEGIHFASE
jgi:hypothetical protein